MVGRRTKHLVQLATLAVHNAVTHLIMVHYVRIVSWAGECSVCDILAVPWFIPATSVAFIFEVRTRSDTIASCGEGLVVCTRRQKLTPRKIGNFRNILLKPPKVFKIRFRTTFPFYLQCWHILTVFVLHFHYSCTFSIFCRIRSASLCWMCEKVAFCFIFLSLFQSSRDAMNFG